MNALKQMRNWVLRPDCVSEALEYALVAGLIVVAALAVIGTVGADVFARWHAINGGL